MEGFIVSDLVSFGPRLSHVLRREVFFVIKVVILYGFVPLGLIDLSTVETCTCLSLEVKDCIEFGIFGTNKTRRSARPFFFYLKSYSSVGLQCYI